MRHSRFAIVISTLILVQPAAACDTTMVQVSMNDASDAIRGVRNAYDVEDARRFARRFRDAAGDLSIQMMSCNCFMAQVDFDSAETYARRASNAYSARELVDEMNRALRAYNAAVNSIAMRAC